MGRRQDYRSPLKKTRADSNSQLEKLSRWDEMRRFFWVGLIVLVSLTAQAQTPPASPAAPAARPPAAQAVPSTPAVPGTKVAVIDFEMAVLESDPGKAATAEFNKQMEPEKAKFDKLEKDVADLQKRLTDAKTEAEKAPIRSEIEAKNVEAQRTQQDAGRKADDLRQRLLAPIATVVNKIVAKYAEANNIAVVFDPNTEPTNIVFANMAADITSEIMRAMNEEYAKDP